MTDNRGQRTEDRVAHSGVPYLKRGLAATLLLSFVFCFLSSARAAPPDSVQLTYDVYKGSLRIGQIEESYSRNKERYTLTSTMRAVGLLALFKRGKILVSSSGVVGANGLQPLSFSDQREGEEKRNRSAEFDWETRQLTLIQRDQRTSVALPDGTQDRLSAMYQFMFLPLHPAASLDFPMTNGGKLDNYHYAISSGQKLATPAGDFDTLYLDNRPKKGESRTEIWLASAHHNLPCKMIITDADGGQFTQILSKISVSP